MMGEMADFYATLDQRVVDERPLRRPTLRRGGKSITKPLPVYSDLAGPHESAKDYWAIADTCWMWAQVHAARLRELWPALVHVTERIAKGETLIAQHTSVEAYERGWLGKLNRLRGERDQLDAAIRSVAWPCWVACRGTWAALQHLTSDECRSLGFESVPSPVLLWHRLDTGFTVPGAWPPTPAQDRREAFVNHDRPAALWQRDELAAAVAGRRDV